MKGKERVGEERRGGADLDGEKEKGHGRREIAVIGRRERGEGGGRGRGRGGGEKGRA